MTRETGIRRELEAGQEPASASLRPAVDWRSINWKRVNRNARRLQKRIVQAQQQGKKRKVRALQFILTRSYSGRCLAVRRVTENTGKRTPGVDGQLLDTPEKKARAVEQLSTEDYKPEPLRRIYIPKGSDPTGKKMRPLGIPTMDDRARQALHQLALDPVAEVTADPHSYGFRKGRSVADAIAQSCNLLSRKTSAQYVLEGDIRSCFDEISHSWLLSHIPMDRKILGQWLKAGFIEQQVHYPTTNGTPQGGVISPVLMNMTLDGLQGLLARRFPKGGVNPVNLIRFADDFIITGRSREILENEVKPLVEEFLKERGLTLSESKTRITHISEGFDFLGSHIRKYRGKFLTKPAKKNVRSFLAEIKAEIRKNLNTPVGKLITILNPMIRGWALFHRSSASTETFNYVDYRIFKEIGRWMQRRHPGKSRSWRQKKYYTQIGDRNYVLQGTYLDRRGEPQTVQLIKAGDIAIKRHIKIKAAANPYDPDWEPYFEERVARQMKDSLPGYERLVKLWFDQDGKCPQCEERITRETGWHLHHRVRLVDGGDDSLSNLTLIHPTCHHQLHAQREKQTAKVAELRPL